MTSVLSEVPVSRDPGVDPGDTLELVFKLSELYDVARTRKRKMYNTWKRNWSVVNNRMWTDGRSSSWMPSPTDSEVYPICSSVVAWQTDQECSFACSAAADPHSAYANWLSGLANDLQAVMQANWHSEQYDLASTLASWDSLLYGAGIFKTVWDSAACEGLGNARLIRVDPWAFYPDPLATSEDDAEFFVEVHQMSFAEIERRYPLAVDKVWENANRLAFSGSTETDQRPDLWDTQRAPKANVVMLPQPAGTPGAYGLPGQGRMSVVADMGIIVKEYWIKENVTVAQEPSNPSIIQPHSVVTDEWRVIVVAGQDCVLMDEKASDLWNCARHPYVRMPFEDLGDFWGMPLVSHLAPPQIAINRLLATIQQNAELTGNPVFLDVQNSGIDRTPMVNRPGTRLSISSSTSQNQGVKPQWLTPPSMPPYIQQTISWWIERMENISGISGPSKGQQPAARTPSASVTATQESGFVRMRSAMRLRQMALSKAGELLAQLVIENYNTPRIVAIAGESGEQTSLALAARHFYSPDSMGATPLRFSLLVDAGANNPTSRSARISESDTLFAMGAIDRQAVLEAHNYPNASAIAERMQQAEAAAALAGQQAHPPGARVRANRTS
jgi:hypothetical protein